MLLLKITVIYSGSFPGNISSHLTQFSEEEIHVPDTGMRNKKHNKTKQKTKQNKTKNSLPHSLCPKTGHFLCNIYITSNPKHERSCRRKGEMDIDKSWCLLPLLAQPLKTNKSPFLYCHKNTLTPPVQKEMGVVFPVLEWCLSDFCPQRLLSSDLLSLVRYGTLCCCKEREIP